MRLSSQDTHTAMLNTSHCVARTYTCDLNTFYSVCMPYMTDVCFCVRDGDLSLRPRLKSHTQGLKTCSQKTQDSTQI